MKKANKITVTTLDTTSNNFTWQTLTFGEMQVLEAVHFMIVLLFQKIISGSMVENLFERICWVTQTANGYIT